MDESPPENSLDVVSNPATNVDVLLRLCAGNREVAAIVHALRDDPDYADAGNQAILHALVDALPAFYNMPERVAAFLYTAGLAQRRTGGDSVVATNMIHALAGAAKSYGPSQRLFEAFIKIARETSSAWLICCLTTMRALYGQDSGKLVKVANILQWPVEHYWEELVGAASLYGDDFELFELFAATGREHGKTGIQDLRRAHEVCGRNVELLRECARYVCLGKLFDLFLEAHTSYGGDMARFRIFEACSNRHGIELLALLIDASAWHKNEVDALKDLCVKIDTYGKENFAVFVSLVRENVITSENCEEFEQEYRTRFPDLPFNAEVIRRLMLAESVAQRREYLESLEIMRQGMISRTRPSKEDRERPEWPWLVLSVFPPGNYGSHETNFRECPDRTSHLRRYRYNKEGYPAKMSGLLGYKVRDGQEENPAVLEKFSLRLQAMRNFITGRGPNNKALREAFERKVDALFKAHGAANFSELTDLSTKDKMLCIYIMEIVHREQSRTYVSDPSLRDLIVEYKYVYHENLENYVRQSGDEVRSARDEVSSRHALLIELATIYGENLSHILQHEFLRDSALRQDILEVYRVLVSKGPQPCLDDQQKDRFRATFMNERITDKRQVLQKQVIAIFGANILFEAVAQREEFVSAVGSILEHLSASCTIEQFFALVPELFILRQRYRSRLPQRLREFFNQDSAEINSELAKYQEEVEAEKAEGMDGEEKIVKKASKVRKVRSFFMKTKRVQMPALEHIFASLAIRGCGMKRIILSLLPKTKKRPSAEV